MHMIKDGVQPQNDALNTSHLGDTGSEVAPRRGGKVLTAVSAVIPSVLALICVGLSLQLPLGTPQEPGPGLWPLLCAAGAAVASLLLLAEYRRVERPEAFTSGSLRAVIGVVSLFVFSFLMPLVGFEIPMFLLTGFWLKVLGKERWRTTIMVAGGCTVGFYLLFILALRLAIPHLF